MTNSSEFLTCQRILVLMVLIGFMIHHSLRVNISIAIVEMVTKNNSNITEENHGPRYFWDEEQKNEILGYFLWGYIITQIPGGRLSEKFGTKIVVGIGLLISSILTILTPLAAHFGYRWMIFVRFCLGVAIGIHWPSTHPMATKWISPNDSAKFMSLMVASSLGVALTLPACGYLIDFLGWQSVFYVTGGIGLTWALSWFYLIYDSPEEHPRISKKEKEKLKNEIVTLKTATKKPPIPWKKIFTSGPVWAIIVGNGCVSCAFFVAFNQLPTYMSQVLHFNIKTNGWFSGLPYFVRYIMSTLSCILADKLKKSEKISTTAIRKFFTITLFVGSGFLFIIQAFWGYNGAITVAVFTVSLGLMGLATPGIYTNPIDIAPAYSGTIFGISQVPGCIVGYISTKVVGLVTKEKQGFEQWIYVFWMVVVVNIFGAVFGYIFISGEPQSWSEVSEVSHGRELEKLKIHDHKDQK